MAKFNSTVHSQISGKLGGKVFLSGKGSRVVSKSSYVKSNSYYSSYTREIFSWLSNRWSKVLTESDRLTWYQYSEGTVTGRTLFFKRNLSLNAGRYGLIPIFLDRLIPVIPMRFPRVNSATIVSGGTKSVSIAFQPGVSFLGSTIVKASPPVSAGVAGSSVKGFEVVGRGGITNGINIVFTDRYNELFGNLSGMAGRVVWLFIHTVASANGQTTPPVLYRVVIT